MRVAVKMIIASVFFLVLGGILCVFSYAKMGNSLQAMSFIQMESKNIKISEAFEDIHVKMDTGQITIQRSEDTSCSILCYQDTKAPFAIKTENGMLSIAETSNEGMTWYEKASLFIDMPKVVISLPKDSYRNLTLQSETGQLTVKGELSFESAVMTSDTGDLTLSKVICRGPLQVKLDTGNIWFEDCDADSIMAETDTGNINASFRTGKTIEAKTDTGNVKIPKESTGGNCRMTTDTGNIIVTIEE